MAAWRCMERRWQAWARRPWFKHQIYAPSFYTGYGVKTLPGIREAIEQHNWDDASAQITVVAQTLERTAADRLRGNVIEVSAAVIQ